MEENGPIKDIVVAGRSAWVDAQTVKSNTPLNDGIEIEIPDVLYLFKQDNKYLIYVNIDGNVYKLTNIGGPENETGNGKLISGGNNRKEHTEVPK